MVETNVLVYRSLVQSILLLYNAETWTLGRRININDYSRFFRCLL